MNSLNQSEPIDNKALLPSIYDIADEKAKENILMVMEILKSDKVELYSDSLIKIRDMIRGYNESPTFSIIPKQLLLLQPYYSFFKRLHKQLIQEPDQQLTADIISVLSIVNLQLDCDNDDKNKKETLKYKLLGSPDCPIDYFGFEYVNHLTNDIINELQIPSNSSIIGDDLNKLINSIVGYYLKSNCITEAIDFTLEIKSLDTLIDYLDCTFKVSEQQKQSDDALEEIITKMGSYLITCATYLIAPDDDYVKSFVIKLYCKYSLWIEALIASLANDFNQPTAIESIIKSCLCSNANRDQTLAIIKQIACVLNRQTIYLHNHPDSTIRGLMASAKSLSLLDYTAKELDCLYSFNLPSSLPEFLTFPLFGTNWRISRSPIRSIVLHIANGFANIASGRDNLIVSMLNSIRPQLLISRYGADCVTSIVGSFGLINLWNPEVTLNSTLNRFKSVPGPELKAASILACSLSRAGYRGDDEDDDFLDCPEFDSIDEGSWDEQISALVGLGVAYSGTNNLEAIYILRRLLRSNKIPLICKGLASLSIGLIAVSSANHKVASHLMANLIQIDSILNYPESLVTCWFICLSIGLIHLRRKDKQLDNDDEDTGGSDTLIKQIDKLSSPRLKSMVKLTLNCCRFAGSGNVEQIQRLLHLISEDSFDQPSTSKLSSSKSTGKPVKSILKRRKENEEKNQNPKKTSIKENETNRRRIGPISTRNVGKGRVVGKMNRKLTHLNEYNSIEEIESSIQPIRNVKRPPPFASTNSTERRTSIRRIRRYSLNRRSSLPVMVKPKPTDNLTNLIHSDTESDRPSTSDTNQYTNIPRATMNLLESLEALNRSLDKLIANDKGKGSTKGKASVTSISVTPPREINKSIAVLGIGLIAMGEEVGTSMAKRVLQQILFNGPPSAKRLVPMAFALLSLSYPDQEIILTLEKYSRYQMISMAMNSMLALGLVGSGSLDNKLSKIIEILFAHYDSGPACCLDSLILSKGLLHLGKGLMTLNPFSHDNQLLFSTGLAAILIFAFSTLDVKHILLGSKLNQMLYYLTPAVRTRFVVTLDEATLDPVEISLGVGQALTTVGQVGKLRLATVMSTQNSPIVLKDNEKAELKTGDYKGVSKMIEGTVIVTKIKDECPLDQNN